MRNVTFNITDGLKKVMFSKEKKKKSGKLCRVSHPSKCHQNVMFDALLSDVLCLPACELGGEFGEEVG